MPLICRAVAVTFIAAALCGCWQGTTREVSSTVLLVDGQPSVDRGARGKLLPLTADLRPGRGDVLETPGASHAGLCLLPNLLVQLDRGARMEIVRLALTKDGNETGRAMEGRFADVKLTAGRMFASHSWGEATASFTVRTPQGDLGTPSNALVCVEVDPQKTRVTCASGWVEFKPAGAATATRIPPGSVGQWPSPAANLSKAETDPMAQEDLQQALEVEQMLRGLMTTKRNVVPR